MDVDHEGKSYLKKPEPFDGNRRKVDDFIYACDLFFEGSSDKDFPTDKQKIIFILSYMSEGEAVYFTLPPLFRRIPTDFHRTQPIPTDSAEQSVGLPTDSVGLDQIPLLVRSKSSESPVKQKSIGLARLTSLLDVRRTSDGLRGRK